MSQTEVLPGVLRQCTTKKMKLTEHNDEQELSSAR